MSSAVVNSSNQQYTGIHNNLQQEINYLMRNFLNSIQSSYMIQRINGWRQTTMKTKYLQINTN